MEGVAAVASADVNDDVLERGGECRDLTDVYVDEALTDKSTHAEILAAEITTRGSQR